ncbi:MAG TPA: hypothetical protein VMM57_07185 [Bacteroidota bacterium]|nr:hypothetical protein [Bacteroidota bacterium]
MASMVTRVFFFKNRFDRAETLRRFQRPRSLLQHLFQCSAERHDRFFNLILFQGRGHAVLNVVLGDQHAQSCQACPHGGNLNENIGAVSVFFGHPNDSVELPDDLFQALCFILYGHSMVHGRNPFDYTVGG